MGITFAQTPRVFGTIHLLCLFLIAIGNLFAFFYLRKKKEKQLLKYLHISGLIMILAELFKQYFCYLYVFNHQINLWFFPWQLCSMAMYCSFFVIHIKNEKIQNALLVFLSSFSLFADLIALALPYDMLRDQVILLIHSFAYHGLIISQSMAAMLMLRKRKKAAFLPSVYLFLFMALIAQAINIIAHQIFHDIHVEPDMFYITPYYPSTQPVFHDIAVRYGIFIEIIVYLSAIILSSFLLYKAEERLLWSQKDNSQ